MAALPLAAFCNDSDGGIVYSIQGTATGNLFGSNTTVSLTDFCNGSALIEYFCLSSPGLGTFISSTGVACNFSCISGACTNQSGGNTTNYGNLITTPSPSNGGYAYGTAYNFSVPAIKNISAVPAFGFSFAGWAKSGNCNATNPNSPNTTANVTSGTCYVYAQFQGGNYSNNTNTTNTTGSLIVKASPEYGGLVYGTEYNFPVPATKTISALVAPGAKFYKWVSSGYCDVINASASKTTVYVQSGICTVIGYFKTNQTANNTNITNISANIADLKVSALVMGVDIPLNQRVYGTVQTSNVGKEVSVSTSTSYYLNGIYVNSVKVPELKPGESSTGEVTFICKRVGTYTLSAKADSADSAKELDERNNEMSIKVICSDSGVAGNAQTRIASSIVDTSGSLYVMAMRNLGIYIESFSR